jgi:uncharacterized protein
VTVDDDDLAEIDLTEDEIDAMMAAGEPVDVTGPDPAHRAYFLLYSDASARSFRWRLVSGDGDVLLTSQSYRTKAEALNAIDAISRAVAVAGRVDQTIAS